MSKGTDRYLVRTYVEGDEAELVRLFNEAYGGFAGFVPRTPKYWRWCCLNRPDVEPKGIGIVNDRTKIIGYGVIGKSGNIWELCYDSKYDGKEVVSTILKYAINYVEKAGGDSVTLNAPASDQLIRDICVRFGFMEVFPPALFISVLDFPSLIREVLDSKREKLREFDEEFLIKLRNPPSWYGGNISVRIGNGKVSIRDVEEEVTTGVVIETDVQTITSCILGTIPLFKVFLGSKLRVRPRWKYLKVLNFLSLIRIEDRWVTPAGDIG